MYRVHVVADSDSRWKWGASLAARLSGLDAAGRVAPEALAGSVFGHLIQGRATPTQQQLDDVGAGSYPVRRAGLGAIVTDPELGSADVVILACVGGTVQASMRGLARVWTGAASRPVVLTGYVGLVYERLVDGLLLRAGADLVLANSAADAARFRSVYTAIHADIDSVVQTALPFLGGARWDRTAAARGARPFTVCFVSQPTVPARRDERRYALQRVIAHAVAFPARRVLVKLRTRPGQQTTHIERHHYFGLLHSTAIPSNVEFVYGAMADVLDDTDLCVTVSSTAALEALHRGIPTAILSDFGVRESLGNHLFLGSGLVTSWSALDRGTIPQPEPGWLVVNGVGDPDPYTSLRERVQKLTAERSWLPPLQSWYDDDIASGYLPRLMARNGLETDGEPALPPVTTAGPAIRLGRQVARRSARWTYRVGVTRFEPALRRWAHL